MKTISIYDSLLVLGRGIGQVMFQNNALSGLLMLVGIFLNSWQLGVLAVGGNIISTLAACISGYGRDDIKNGLHENSDCYTYQCAVKTIQSILYIVTSIT